MAKASRPQEKKTVSRIRRGDVCLISFDPTVGREIRKTRPALVIQNDIGNQYSPLTIVAAITSQISPQPFPVEVVVEPGSANGLTKTSAVRLDRIRTIDGRRILKRLGSVDASTLRSVDDAIRISVGLVTI